jgi:SAM-dependent methyltransferase
MTALKQAIEMNVNQGSTFLDAGSGTGIWAILAAKLGASRVVAVELEESLIPLIFKHAQENGVAERIEIIQGNIDDVRLPGKFDVIVAELFAGDVFSDATTRSIIDLRERYLSEGGIIIPQWMKLWAAPVLRSEHDGEEKFDLRVSTNFLSALRPNYGRPTNAVDRNKVKLAAEPKLLNQIDYLTIKEPPRREPMTAEWTLQDVSSIDSLIVYCTSQYAPGVLLETWSSDTWFHEMYDFTPFEVTNGRLIFTANFDPSNPSWSMSVPSHPELMVQNFSPVFAYTRARMAMASTPYKRARKSRKRKE